MGANTPPSTIPADSLRPSPDSLMIATGFGAVVLGGLVAAVTRPLELGYGSWVAAFLVLVCGVAQIAMGEGRKRQVRRRPANAGWTQWSCWNAGGLVIIVGTLVARPWLVDLGSMLLFVALALALDATRTGGQTERDSRLWFVTYRAVLVILAVSIPIGIVLSHVRHG